MESVNALIRRDYPKQTDFESLTQYQLGRVEELGNNLPRKPLKFRTSNEAYNELSPALPFGI